MKEDREGMLCMTYQGCMSCMTDQEGVSSYSNQSPACPNIAKVSPLSIALIAGPPALAASSPQTD